MTSQVAVSVMKNDTPRVRGQGDISSALVGKVIRKILKRWHLSRNHKRRERMNPLCILRDWNHLGKDEKAAANVLGQEQSLMGLDRYWWTDHMNLAG